MVFKMKCDVCGKTFEANSPSHKTCPDCFSKRRGHTSSVHRDHPRSDPGRRPSSGTALPSHLKLDRFYSEKGSILPEVYRETSMGIAEEFQNAQMTASSIRRFFESVRTAYDRFSKDPEKTSNPEAAFERALVNILRLQPIVHKSEERGITKPCFTEFMDHYIKMTQKDKENLKGFKELFMSVIGYLKK